MVRWEGRSFVSVGEKVSRTTRKGNDSIISEKGGPSEPKGTSLSKRGGQVNRRKKGQPLSVEMGIFVMGGLFDEERRNAHEWERDRWITNGGA